jgi:hypothetical protein
MPSKETLAGIGSVRCETVLNAGAALLFGRELVTIVATRFFVNPKVAIGFVVSAADRSGVRGSSVPV